MKSISRYLSFSSWPGLTRPSTPFLLKGRQDVDARHKAGHDELLYQAPRLSRGPKSLTIQPSAQQACAGLAQLPHLWQSAGENRYGMETPQTPNEDLSGRGDKNQATDQGKAFRTRPGGAAASAFIYPPQHYNRRRLCMAERPQLAGSAARSLSARDGYS